MKVYILLVDEKNIEVFADKNAADNEAKFLSAKSKTKKEISVIEKELR